MSRITAVLLALTACGGPGAGSNRPAGPATAPPVAAPAPGAQAADLGAISFAVTGGTPEARRAFLRGVLALHSFWYDEAVDEFKAAVAADPTFVMGHWGLAFAHAQLLFGALDDEHARAALAKLPPLEGASARERGWIDATRILFGEEPQQDRLIAFARAMGALHRDYPDDDEIAAFHALAMLSARTPDDPDDLRVRGEAGAIALGVMARNPRHPGAVHYVIHAFDTPELAPLALPAARAYAGIAPAAFHARHMPAHIFARLGLWEQAMASCRSAWDASVAAATARKRPLNARDYHSLTWMLQFAFERGQRKTADATLAQMRADLDAANTWPLRSSYIGMVEVYMMNTEDWGRLEELLAPLARPGVEPPQPAPAHLCEAPEGAKPPAPATAAAPATAPPPDRPPPGFDEGFQLAYLRMGVALEQRDRATANRLVREIEALLRKGRPFQIRMMGAKRFAEEEEKARPFRELDRKLREAHLRHDNRAALPLARKLAALIDARPDAEPPVQGGSPHEGIARLLMELDRPAEALTELELVLKNHPDRARVLLAAM
ncbi:MAG TPA: hypothetical protein VMZ28_26260, partial [Kofleriaceae bacterium]|nr:hypothetical protein [Kofleriaceae bacterium]